MTWTTSWPRLWLTRQPCSRSGSADGLGALGRLGGGCVGHGLLGGEADGNGLGRPARRGLELDAGSAAGLSPALEQLAVTDHPPQAW